MEFRPRWSLHYQMTLLAVFVTLVAVLVVGLLIESQGKATLLERETGNLQNATNLDVKGIQNELQDLGRRLRVFTAGAQPGNLANTKPPDAVNLPPFPTLPGGKSVGRFSEVCDRPDFHTWWEAGVKEFLRDQRPQADGPDGPGGGNPDADGFQVGRRQPGETPGQYFDMDAVEMVLVYNPGPKPQFVGGARTVGNERLKFKTAAEFGPLPGDQILTQLVEEVANHGQQSPIADATPFILEDEKGAKVCRIYLARRVVTRSMEKGAAAGYSPPIGVIAISVNVTRYLNTLARLSPRHTYFLLDSAGTYLYHPDPAMTGTKLTNEDPLQGFQRAQWGANDKQIDKVERRLKDNGGDSIPADPTNLTGEAIPDIHYYHAKKHLPFRDPKNLQDPAREKACRDFNRAMAELAAQEEKHYRDEGQAAGRPPADTIVFRYSELSVDDSRVEISHQSEKGLDRARKRVDELLATWPSTPRPLGTRLKQLVLGRFGAPGAGWYDTLDCTEFFASLTLLDTGLGRPLEKDSLLMVRGYQPQPGLARFVSAAAVKELEQDAEVATLPAMWFTLVTVCLGAAALAYALSVYIAKPLHRIGEAAHTLAQGAKQVAESEADPTMSGERFVVDLPTSGPSEVMEVTIGFQEMVRQLERMTGRLRRRNAEMRTVLRTAVDGIVIFTDRGEIEIANAAAEAMFGYAPGELVGHRVQRLVQLPANSPLRLIRSGQPASPGESITDGKQSVGELIRQAGVEMKAVRKDGTEFWTEAGFNEVPVGDRVLYTGIIRDISTRKAAEQEIRKINADLDRRVKERTAMLVESNDRLELALERARAAGKAKDTFVANMSHELRQPLNTVIGYAELLREEAEDEGNTGVVKHLDKILTAARHLLGLINDILDLAKIADEKLELSNREFEIRRLINDLYTLAEPLSRKNGNALNFPPPGDLGRMIGDELRVRQILLNLVSNACKFTSHGTVSVSVSTEPGRDGTPWVRFAIQDTGKGMTPEQASQLFQRFYQADDSTRRQQGGTGLGLAITRSLCELMGGEVTVASQVDVGSEFVVRLPTRPPAPAAKEPRKEPTNATPVPTAPGTAPNPAPPRRTVLVIDDDPSARELMKRFLEKDGFAVITASTGEEGLQMAKLHHPALITLDVMMAGVDGWATLAALKTDCTTYSIPVVMVTMVDDRGRGFALGATDYLTKPVNWQQLGATLRKYIPHPPTGPVLVVDDDPEQVNLVSRLLAKEGWEVMIAANGEEGLARLDERRPALILLDLMMPVMDGFQFMAELHRRNPQPPIPVIVVTAKDLHDEEIQRLNGGVAHVVQKGTSLSLDEIFRRARAGDAADGPEVPHA